MSMYSILYLLDYIPILSQPMRPDQTKEYRQIMLKQFTDFHLQESLFDTNMYFMGNELSFFKDKSLH